MSHPSKISKFTHCDTVACKGGRLSYAYEAMRVNTQSSIAICDVLSERGEGGKIGKLGNAGQFVSTQMEQPLGCLPGKFCCRHNTSTCKKLDVGKHFESKNLTDFSYGPRTRT